MKVATPDKNPNAKAHRVWRCEYIRLLTDGPREGDVSQLELDLMAELIKEEYAEGVVRKNQIGETSGIVWVGPTVKGRIFADELSDYLEKKSKMYQFRIALFAIAGWLAGIFSAVVTAKLTE
jgi:hypothetical protein